MPLRPRRLERIPREGPPTRNRARPVVVRLRSGGSAESTANLVDEVIDDRREIDLVVLAREADVGDEVAPAGRDPREHARVVARLHVVDRDTVATEAGLSECASFSIPRCVQSVKVCALD